MNTRDIKTKKPWRRIKPTGYLSGGDYSFADDVSARDESVLFSMVSQADFIREYYPSGHRINDRSASVSSESPTAARWRIPMEMRFGLFETGNTQ